MSRAACVATTQGSAIPTVETVWAAQPIDWPFPHIPLWTPQGWLFLILQVLVQMSPPQGGLPRLHSINKVSQWQEFLLAWSQLCLKPSSPTTAVWLREDVQYIPETDGVGPDRPWGLSLKASTSEFHS